MAPSWLVFGDSALPAAFYHSLTAGSAAPLRAPSCPSDLPSTQRARLPPAPQPAASLREQRRRGISLCSRERSQREIAVQRRVDADAAAEAVVAAEAWVEELRTQLAEGLINPDGTQAPPKRKRQSGSRPPGSRRSTGEKEGGEKPRSTPSAAAPKRPRPSDGSDAGGSGGPPKKAKAVTAGPSAPAAEKPAKKGGKKAAPAAPSLYDVGAVVEVSLRLGEAFANWYHARLVEHVKGRWKASLQRSGPGGEWEPLLLEGRTAAEWVKSDMMRPLPPAQLGALWSPSVGEHCELFFADGWWKVRVTEAAGGDYTVNYAPANAVHTVPRDRLRPILTWDAAGQQYAPIKGAGRR